MVFSHSRYLQFLLMIWKVDGKKFQYVFHLQQVILGCNHTSDQLLYGNQYQIDRTKQRITEHSWSCAEIDTFDVSTRLVKSQPFQHTYKL